MKPTGGYSPSEAEREEGVSMELSAVKLISPSESLGDLIRSAEVFAC
jgi:hypothetical protein